MFDLAWSEIALIAVVALIAIGPKDLPVAMKAVSEMIKKARRMAGEFQTHVDEMVREADLQEVRTQFNELRSMDVKGKILNAVDSDGSLRRTINENPLNPALYTPPPPVEVSPVAPDPNAVPPPAPPVASTASLPEASAETPQAAPHPAAAPVAAAPAATVAVPPVEAPPVAPAPNPPDTAATRPSSGA